MFCCKVLVLVLHQQAGQPFSRLSDIPSRFVVTLTPTDIDITA